MMMDNRKFFFLIFEIMVTVQNNKHCRIIEMAALAAAKV